jgi:hypothetical protein
VNDYDARESHYEKQIYDLVGSWNRWIYISYLSRAIPLLSLFILVYTLKQQTEGMGLSYLFENIALLALPSVLTVKSSLQTTIFFKTFIRFLLSNFDNLHSSKVLHKFMITKAI